MIFRANRALLGPAETANAADLLLPRGTCIWIPRGWMYPAGHGTNETACAPAQQMPDLQKVFGGQAVWDRWVSVAQRAKGLSSRYLLSFGINKLHKLTQQTIGPCQGLSPCRPEDAVDDAFKDLTGWYFLHARLPLVAPANVVAAAMIQLNGWHPNHIGFAWDVRIVNGSPPWCTDRPCTLGQYIFLNSQSAATIPIYAHEYVHVLQYEGGGPAFIEKYLGSEVANQITNHAADILANFPGIPSSLYSALRNIDLPSSANAEEAVPYLWQAYIGTEPPPSERPWNTWKSHPGWFL
jgi:hypothetical protein